MTQACYAHKNDQCSLCAHRMAAKYTPCKHDTQGFSDPAPELYSPSDTPDFCANYERPPFFRIAARKDKPDEPLIVIQWQPELQISIVHDRSADNIPGVLHGSGPSVQVPRYFLYDGIISTLLADAHGDGFLEVMPGDYLVWSPREDSIITELVSLISTKKLYCWNTIPKDVFETSYDMLPHA